MVRNLDAIFFTHSLKNRVIEILLSIIILLSITCLFSKLAPYNMDEFCHYHSITSRHYKYNVLNTFRENCRGYDLNLLNTGLILPLRAYPYEGSSTSLYYYPLFRIWKDPRSARFFGMLFLLLQSLLLARILNYKYEYVLLFLISFFPYFFQHLVDTGPINFTTTSIFLLYWLMIKWLRNLQLRYPLLMALIIFLGIWAKLTYLWLLPGIAILFLALLIEKKELPDRRKLMKMAFQILGSVFLLLGLLSLIFLSTSPKDSSVYPYIDLVANSKSLSIQQLSQISFVKELEVVKSLLNPFEATQRIFVVREPNVITKLYTGLILLFVPVCLLLVRKNWFEKIKPALPYFAGVVTFIITLRTERAWAMHHAVLSFPFLILSIFLTIDLLRRRYSKAFPIIISALIIILAVLNGYFFITFSKQEIREHDDWSKIEIHKLLQDQKLAKGYFYVVVDWGMYYYQGLYGPDSQSVLYMEPLDKQSQIDALKELSKKHNRKLLFIYRNYGSKSSLSLIRGAFHLQEYGTTSADQMWRIMMEDS